MNEKEAIFAEWTKPAFKDLCITPLDLHLGFGLTVTKATQVLEALFAEGRITKTGAAFKSGSEYCLPETGAVREEIRGIEATVRAGQLRLEEANRA